MDQRNLDLPQDLVWMWSAAVCQCSVLAVTYLCLYWVLDGPGYDLAVRQADSELDIERLFSHLGDKLATVPSHVYQVVQSVGDGFAHPRRGELYLGCFGWHMANEERGQPAIHVDLSKCHIKIDRILAQDHIASVCPRGCCPVFFVGVIPWLV